MVILALAVSSAPPVGAQSGGANGKETPIVVLPLEGPLASPYAELSGLAWYGDYLVLLPQHPEHVDGSLFILGRGDIERFLSGDRTRPLVPVPVPLRAGREAVAVRGSQGFEAIAFSDDRAYLTVEARDEQGMVSYIVAGRMAGDLSELVIEGPVATVRPQAQLGNIGEEALLAADGTIISLHEVYGAAVNPQPVAHRFSGDLATEEHISFPPLEYRVTDATGIDADGRFWVTNYFWPGDDALVADVDPLAETYGKGASHASSPVVERLVELQLRGDSIVRTKSPPIQLLLDDRAGARNWEGIARLGERGFLVVTDRYPDTIFAFVPR